MYNHLGCIVGRKDVPFYWTKFKSSNIGQRVLCICSDGASRDAQLSVLRQDLGQSLVSEEGPEEETTVVMSPPTAVLSPRARDASVYYEPNQGLGFFDFDPIE